MIACASTVAVVLVSAVAASPATAAIALRGTPTSAANNRATLTIAKPAAAVTGDVLLASVTRLGTTAITPPAGWTQVRTDTNPSGRMSTFVRVVAAGEAGPYVFSFGANAESSGVVVAYSGADTAAPVDANAGTFGASGAATIPSVATTYLNAKRVAFAAIGGATPIGWTGATERVEVGSPSFRLAAADSDHAAAGNTGTATATGASSSWLTHAVALTEAPELTATLPPASYTFGSLEPGGVNESTDQVTSVTSNRAWGLKIRDTGGNAGRMRQWTGAAYGAGLLSAPLQWRLHAIGGTPQATAYADLTASPATVVSGRPASAAPVAVAVRYHQPIAYADARLPAGQSYRTSIEYDAAHGF